MPRVRSDVADTGRVSKSRESQSDPKEVVDDTFEDHLHAIVVLERADDLSDLQNEFGPVMLTGGLSSMTRQCECVTRLTLTASSSLLRA
jgi:hypothetical protein